MRCPLDVLIAVALFVVLFVVLAVGTFSVELGVGQHNLWIIGMGCALLSTSPLLCVILACIAFPMPMQREGVV